MAARQAGVSARACRARSQARCAGPAPVAGVALPPPPPGPELDHRQVPGEREPHGPRARRARASWSPLPRRPPARPWAARHGPATPGQAAVGGEVRPQVGVGSGRRRRARSASSRRPRARRWRACRAAPVGRVRRRPGRRTGRRRRVARRGRPRAAGPARRPWAGPPGGSAQVASSPTVSGVGPGVLDPPLEDPDRQGAPLEVPGDDRRQLLADEPDAEDRRVRTSATPAGTARGTSRRRPAGPSPTRAAPPRAEAPRGRSPGRPSGPPDEQREPVGRDRPERVPPHLEVPARDIAAERAPDAAGAEPADRHAGPLAVVDHRQVDPRWPTSGQGTPMPRRQATAGMAGQSRRRRRPGSATLGVTCRPR